MNLRCYCCKSTKPQEEFNKALNMTRGFSGDCRDCTKANFKSWYIKNAEKTRIQKAQYKKDNAGKINSINAKRRAAKLQRTPKWLTELHYSQIEMFYDTAERLTNEFGIPMDVDHIIPLQGKNVSGLHVPWNLQVISGFENGSKGNKCV